MINLLRLFSLIMLFLISQSGIATTSNLANHQYDVDHLVLSEKIYDYDTTSNFQCCRIPSNVNAQDRSFLVFVSDFPAAKSVSSQILGTTTKQLQKKFKHASDFGVTGNFNKVNAAKFNSAINQHINSAGVKAIQGTYRGNPVTHYVNPQTGLNAMADKSGNFVSGWKLGAEQLQNVLTRGGL